MRKTLALIGVLLASSLAFSQAAYIKAVDTKTISTSATPYTHFNNIGELNISVEYVITGAPATMSITLQGCMRGGDCTTLNTYTSTSSGLVSLTGLFDQYTITPTWTGGASPTVQINWLGTANSSPASINTPGSSDPCQNQAVIKSNAAVNIGSATTTQLVAAVGVTSIYVCAFSGTAAAGTGATYQFESGTGGTCGTSTVLLTGAMVGGQPLALGEFHTGSATALCAVTGGTSPSLQGVLTYVQQ